MKDDTITITSPDLNREIPLPRKVTERLLTVLSVLEPGQTLTHATVHIKTPEGTQTFPTSSAVARAVLALIKAEERVLDIEAQLENVETRLAVLEGRTQHHPEF